MKLKKVVALMVALTKGGKTTAAIALTDNKHRGKLYSLVNNRTEVTTDWEFDPSAEYIKLSGVIISNKSVFGTDIEEKFSCEKFNEILDSKDGVYLKRFGLEKQTDLDAKELKEYVDGKINEFVNDCDDKALSGIILDRKSNRFLKRIRVTIPPVNALCKVLKEQNISFVLRDTRGLLDLDPEEATQVSERTMTDLGIDGIDGVLLFGTSTPFPDVVNWYRKAYKEAFESVPIFLMSRSDSVSTLYDLLYGIKDNVNLDNVKSFLDSYKKGTERGFGMLQDSFTQCHRLLESFEMGKYEKGKFSYNYKTYELKDMQYISASSKTLEIAKESEVPDYDAADYKLYELILFENIKDMIHKLVDHMKLTEAIKAQVKKNFFNSLQDEHIQMVPDYRNYIRENVCNNIKNGAILGPRGGIVTVSRGNIEYLGAVTSAVSARVWLWNKVYSYKHTGEIKDSQGNIIGEGIPEENRNNLIRMALFNTIEKYTDVNAYFRNYYFFDRKEVYKGIVNCRKIWARDGFPSDASENNLDELDEASKSIIRCIFVREDSVKEIKS